MVMSGCHRQDRALLLMLHAGIGNTLLIMDGFGCRIMNGAGLRSIMVAGTMTTIMAGCGCRVMNGLLPGSLGGITIPITVGLLSDRGLVIPSAIVRLPITGALCQEIT